jgi:hypothetical protein
MRSWGTLAGVMCLVPIGAFPGSLATNIVGLVLSAGFVLREYFATRDARRVASEAGVV